MAKRIKCLIGNWANIGHGTKVYDLISGKHKDIAVNNLAPHPLAPPPPVVSEEVVTVIPSQSQEIVPPKKEQGSIALKELEQAALVSK